MYIHEHKRPSLIAMVLNKHTLILAVILIIILALPFFYSDRLQFTSGIDSFAKTKNSITGISDTANLPGLRDKKRWEQCLRSGNTPKYYMSIIVVTRNDDYAGGQHHRMQNHIDSTWLLAEKTKQKIELIIIEWNPPTDKRRIIDAYRSPSI